VVATTNITAPFTAWSPTPIGQRPSSARCTRNYCNAICKIGSDANKTRPPRGFPQNQANKGSANTSHWKKPTQILGYSHQSGAVSDDMPAMKNRIRMEMVSNPDRTFGSPWQEDDEVYSCQIAPFDFF
jgi:hypothetical protein